MVDIGFVILHYKTFDDTRNCVESILRNVPNAPIIVVDNGSCNGTGEKLKKLYKESTDVTVLISNDNLGFANGNNKGICFLRRKYLPKFVVVMNNDTLIKQTNFIEIVKNEYESSNFAVLGPQIITRDGLNNSNPVEYVVDRKSKASVLLIKRKIKLLLNKLHLNRFLHDVGTSIKHEGKYNNLQRYENVKLHGACWIFSDKFFEKYDGINKSTFLYFEEDILYLETRRKGLKTVYNPDLIVTHLEDSSTNNVTQNSREKNIFVLCNEIRSLKVLKKLL